MSHAADDAADAPIEDYLDHLVTELSGHSPRELRRLLAEAEAHLYDDAQAARSRGVPAREAAEQAVARFGPADRLADADRARLATPPGLLVRQILGSALLLGGIGAVGVGISGLVALVIRWTAGAAFLAGPAPGQALAPADCERWLSQNAAAHNCAAAATADWAAETVFYRMAFGLLGVAALLTFRQVTRRGPTLLTLSTLHPMVADTIAATAFGAAALWTLGLGVDAVAVASGNGAGQWFSATPVALIGAVYFGTRLIRTLRTPVTA